MGGIARVLYYNRMINHPAGCGVHAREFVRALTSLGQAVTVYPSPRQVLRPALGPPRRIFDRFPSTVIELAVAVREYGRSLYDYKNALRVALNCQADIVLARLQGMDWTPLWLARRLKIPVVLEANTPIAYEVAMLHGSRSLRFYERSEQKNWQESSGIIVVSQVLKDHLVSRGVPPKKMWVNPNGVDGSLFSPVVSGERIVQRYGLKPRCTIGFVGSLQRWHGVHLLVQAFAELASQFPDATLLVVGEGKERQNLQRRVLRIGLQHRIHFAGQVDYSSVPDFIAAMDICVAPYPKLPLFYFSPIKVFEYMAMAKPVVASRQGQLTELVSHCGRLFEPGNVEQMLENIAYLLTHPDEARDMGIQAREKVLSKFTWIHNAQRVMIALAEASRSHWKGNSK